GAARKGVPPEVAGEVFERLRAFGGYSFPKSHAAAFAVLVYQSAWLKRYHPAAFYAALLNHQPMGFWSPAVIVNDAKRHGLKVYRADVNRSAAACTVEAGGLRLGLGYVKGLGEAGSRRVVEARGETPFGSLADLCRRTRLPRSLVENLILAGALDGWGIPRRRLLWELGRLRYPAEALPLAFPGYEVALPPLGEAEALGHELGLTGVAAGRHPLSFYRDWLAGRGIRGCGDLAGCRDGDVVRVAGRPGRHPAPPAAN